MTSVNVIPTQWGPAIRVLNVKNGIVTDMCRSAIGVLSIEINHSLASATPMRHIGRSDIRV